MNSTLLQLLLGGMAPGGGRMPGEAPRNQPLELDPSGGLGVLGGASALSRALSGPGRESELSRLSDGREVPAGPYQMPGQPAPAPTPGGPGAGMAGPQYRDLIMSNRPAAARYFDQAGAWPHYLRAYGLHPQGE